MRKPMNKTRNDLKRTLSCTEISSKERQLIYITRKISAFSWYLVDLFSCKLNGIAAIYERSIDKEYKREYGIVKFSKEDKVLHIGCGAYPLTDITLAVIPKVQHIIGIDNKTDIVKLAQKIVDKKNLQKQIKIEYGDGQHYSVSDFDVIIISSCSWPTIPILEKIFQTSKKGSKIIVRELDFAIGPVIRCIRSHKNIEIKQRLYHRPFPFFEPFGWQSFFLVKK